MALGVQIPFIQMPLKGSGFEVFMSLFYSTFSSSLQSASLQKGSYRGLELLNFRLLHRLSEIGFCLLFSLKHCH